MGLILLVSSLALGYSAYQANLGGIQNLQAAQAEVNAETGAAQIYNALNNQYFFLARVSNGQWSGIYQSYQNISTTNNCDSFTLPPSITSTSNPLSGTGRNWRMISYTADPVAGISSLVVEGSSPIGGARTQVQYTYTLTSQPARGELGFPGLLAQNITLGNNDVLGVTINGTNSCSGNILCTNCQSISNVGQLANSIVQGVISVGPITWPAVPTAPSGSINLGDVRTSLSLPRPGDAPVLEYTSSGVPVYSYVYNLSSITLSGSETITINTSTPSSSPAVVSCDGTPNSTGATGCHPVVLHISGNLSMSGNAKFAHTGDPEDFIIYGNPVGGASQTLTLNGGSTASKLFVYAPTATVGINGGSATPDFYGAVWGKTWNGSSSNNAEIVVPADMYQRVKSLPLTPLPSTDFRLQSASSWERGK